MNSGHDRSVGVPRRGRLVRTLGAGVFLLLELPLLFPLIAGAGAMAVVAQIAALVQRLGRGGSSR